MNPTFGWWQPDGDTALPRRVVGRSLLHAHRLGDAEGFGLREADSDDPRPIYISEHSPMTKRLRALARGELTLDELMERYESERAQRGRQPDRFSSAGWSWSELFRSLGPLLAPKHEGP